MKRYNITYTEYDNERENTKSRITAQYTLSDFEIIQIQQNFNTPMEDIEKAIKNKLINVIKIKIGIE